MEGPNPFPVDGPVRPEDRLIGRSRDVEDLFNAVRRRQNPLLLSPRRTGKTSLALACLDRSRASKELGLAFDFDLSSSTLSSAGSLAVAWADKARNAGLSSPIQGLRRTFGKMKGRSSEALKVLGLTEEGKAFDLIAEILAPTEGEGYPSLEEVSRVISASLLLSDRRLVVFLDEVQDLDRWGDAQIVQGDIARVIASHGDRIGFLFAGSEESAVAGLFEQGKPLHNVGIRFPLNSIAMDDWQEGIVGRFEEVGLEIARQQVTQILHASDLHPQRTMRICFHAWSWCESMGSGTVTELIVDRAVEDAKGHPSWP